MHSVFGRDKGDKSKIGMSSDEVSKAMSVGIQRVLNGLIGKRCWHAIAGTGAGSAVALGFGERYKRKRPLSNPCLTQEEREFDSHDTLFLECAWRVELAGEVIGGSGDSNNPKGALVTAANSIVGRRVECINLSASVMDLVLTFDGEVELIVFGEKGDSVEDYGDNYTVGEEAGLYIVRGGGEIVFEARSK